jgi:peptidoglycan hydrolase CwlO-like protein
MKLEAEENDLNKITMKFKNMQEELEFKHDKLAKIWERLQGANAELQQINEDFDRERNDMYDTIYELTN